MKAVMMLLVFASASLGSELCGIWILKSSKSTAAPASLIVQIEQTQDQLVILKITAGILSRRVYRLAEGLEVRTFPHGSEIRLPGETWVIGSDGQLTIGGHLVLVPAQKMPEFGGVR